LTWISPDDLWRRAMARWAEITAISPDLAPAVALQQGLLRLILDAAAQLQHDQVPGLDPLSAIDRWRRGVPALRNQAVPIPAFLHKLPPELCAVLAEGGAADSAVHIRDAILDKHIDAGSLLSVSLARNQKAIRTSALHMGFAPDLLWLVGELGSCALAHHLQSQLSADRTIGTMEGGAWDRGYCPVCGSWPACIESLDGSRLLRCSYCAMAWNLPSRCCIYCGNGGSDFVSAVPDTDCPRRRIELCSKCANYTKVLETSEPTPFPLGAIEDLASLDLDQAAMERGYQRPELKNLDALEPFKSTC
jgi:Protein involved in formate dehydrogenase formation